jgi:hypothetical protein
MRRVFARTSLRALRLLALACALLVVPACARELFESDVLLQHDLSGSVRVPLQTNVEGVTYALRDATVELSGTAMVTLSSDNPADDALRTPLPAGRYGLYLRPGFRVIAIDEHGHERTVTARLISPNPARLRVAEIDDVTARLTFEHAGGTIEFGAARPVRVTSAR